MRKSLSYAHILVSISDESAWRKEDGRQDRYKETRKRKRKKRGEIDGPRSRCAEWNQPSGAKRAAFQASERARGGTWRGVVRGRAVHTRPLQSTWHTLFEPYSFPSTVRHPTLLSLCCAFARLLRSQRCPRAFPAAVRAFFRVHVHRHVPQVQGPVRYANPWARFVTRGRLGLTPTREMG